MNFRSRRLLLALCVALPLVLGWFAWKAASTRPTIRAVAKDETLALSWASDGRTLRVASKDGRLRTVSAPWLEKQTEVKIFDAWPPTQYSDDGRRIALSDGNEIKVLDTVSGRRIWSSQSVMVCDDGEEGARIGYLALSPDGNTVAVCEGNGARGGFYLRDIRNGHNSPRPRWLPTLPMRGREEPSFLAFSPDSRRLVVSSENRFLSLIDVASGKTLWQRDIVPPNSSHPVVQSLSFARDGLSFVVGTTSEVLARVDLNTGAFTPLKRGYFPNSGLLALSPDGKCLAIAQRVTQIEVWNFPAMSLNRQIPIPDEAPTVFSFSPDSRTLAIGTQSGAVQLWPVG